MNKSFRSPLSEAEMKSIRATIQLMKDRPWMPGFRATGIPTWPGEVFYSRILRIRRYKVPPIHYAPVEARIWLFKGRLEISFVPIPKHQWVKRKR